MDTVSIAALCITCAPLVVIVYECIVGYVEDYGV